MTFELTKGIELYNQKKYHDALLQLEKAKHLEPSNAAVHMYLGATLSALGKHTDAAETYSKSLELNPDDPKVLFNMACSLKESSRPHDALDTISKSIRIEDNRIESYILKYQLQCILEKPPEDLSITVNSWLRLNPTDADAHIAKATLLMGRDQLDDAMGYVDNAIRLNPNNADAYCNKGYILHNWHKYKEAMSYIDKSLELDPSVAQPHHFKALILSAIGSLKDALKEMNIAIKLDPNDPDYMCETAMIYFELGSMAKYIQMVDAALHIDPSHAEANYRKGEYLADCGHYEQGKKFLYCAILNNAHNDIFVALSEISILNRSGKFGDALKVCEKALILYPGELILEDYKKALSDKLA